jgi:hypothetical protein
MFAWHEPCKIKLQQKEGDMKTGVVLAAAQGTVLSFGCLNTENRTVEDFDLARSQRRQSHNERKGRTMKTKLFRTVTLGALLTLAAASTVFAMDHGSMDHGAGGTMSGMHDTVPSGGAATQPARHGVEIRKTVVSGYALTYNLIDMKTMMQSTSMPMTHNSDIKMKSHHLMVYPVRPDGKPATGGKAGYLVVQPDKTEVKTLTMLMEDGYGADVDLVAIGDYKITTKIVLGDATLVDEFVYTVKKIGSSKIAVVNSKCPITGGALSQDGVVESLTRDYKGQKIGFCCDGCPAEWDKLSDADKDAELAKIKKPAPVKAKERP